MKKKLLIGILLVSFSLTACGNEANKEVSKEETVQTEQVQHEDALDTATVKIKDLTGEIEVRKNPKRVVALDNMTFKTLEDWGVTPVAVPKAVMPATSGFVKNDDIQDIGNHKEPNLELLAAADPDLIIVGQRFAKYTDELKELCPNADVIDLNWDVSNEAANPGENLINGFKDSLESLGKIFDKEDEAKVLIEKRDNSIAEAKDAYKDGTVMSVVVSGGEIGYSAPGYGRFWGPLYEILDLTPAIEVENSSTDHKGDDISVEAIAESNPSYLLVLDRDAATISEGGESTPAKDVIEGSQALHSTDAIKNSKVYYAPDDTYTNESPQTFIKIFEGLKELFSE